MEITDKILQFAGEVFIGAVSGFGAFYKFFSGKLKDVDARVSVEVSKIERWSKDVDNKIHDHDTKIVQSEANHTALKETVKTSFERIDRAIENGR